MSIEQPTEQPAAPVPVPADGDAWELPGSRAGRRATIFGTAARIGARYASAKWWSSNPAALERANALGARDLYRAAVTLRGGFLKLGQFASARPDLLPEEYVNELSKLQDRVPPAPMSVMSRVIEEDVGPPDRDYGHVDPSAYAASLAQVHRAVRRDGRTVAVKVQYPTVREIVPREAADTRRILGVVDRFLSGLDLATIGYVLEHGIASELDYVQEAANIERFKANFAAEPQIDVPSVHHDLSKGRVLVMDWIEGENLARALREADHALAEEAARILVDAYLKQFLVDGFLHADPHPGNFLLQPGPRLGIVDFGACSALSDETRMGVRHLYQAGMRQDVKAIAEGLDALGFRTRSGDLQALVAWASLFNFDDVSEDREDAWRKLMAARKQDPLVKIPDELIMLGRVLIVQTGLVARIRPTWSLEELIERRLGDGSPATPAAP